MSPDLSISIWMIFELVDTYLGVKRQDSITSLGSSRNESKCPTTPMALIFVYSQSRSTCWTRHFFPSIHSYVTVPSCRSPKFICQ